MLCPIKLRNLAVCVLFATFGAVPLAAEPLSGARKELRTIPELIQAAPPDDGSRPACKNPREYIELLNSERYSEISALFAENAVHYGPDGITRRGREALHEFYLKPFRKNHTVYVTSALQEGRDCVLGLAAGAPGAEIALRGVDLFKVNEKGEIEWFIVFVSPSPTLPSDNLDLNPFLKERAQ